MAHAFHADDIDVDADEVRAAFERGEIQLIDVREPYEYEAGRIAGARHIELERLASKADTIDRDTTGRLRLPPRRTIRHGRQRLPPRRLGRSLDGRRDGGVGRRAGSRSSPRAGMSRITRALLLRRRCSRCSCPRAPRRTPAFVSLGELRRADLRHRAAARHLAACSWSSAAATIQVVKSGTRVGTPFLDISGDVDQAASAACSR